MDGLAAPFESAGHLRAHPPPRLQIRLCRRHASLHRLRASRRAALSRACTACETHRSARAAHAERRVHLLGTDRPRMFGAMILAAGRGERMRPLSDQTPKPLLRVGGKPLIVWQIEALARAGFRDLVVNVSHHANQLIDFLNDGNAWGVQIKWSIEATPL